ncbi:MAG: hypothetical protein ACHQRK_08575 [Gemmatimonadales bacterium]
MFRPLDAMSPLLAAVITVLAVAAAPAQSVPAGPNLPCDGLIVSRIDIRPGRPPFQGTSQRWRAAARAVGLHHATTTSAVVGSFLALHLGRPCTELRRSESERILRAQPFIADATVTTSPDGRGGVIVLVETVDEIPVLVGAQFRGIAPRELSLGNSNIGGRGLRVEGRVERGYAYRTGFGLHAMQYSIAGHPYIASIEGERNTLGYLASASLEHPFFTDLQRLGWHVDYLSTDGYPGLRRPARDELALGVQQERWDASSLTRVFGTRTVGLLGLGASGLRVTPAQQGIVVADTGIAADTGVTLRNRYAPFHSGRLGVIGALRRVTFRTVRGFDGLKAQQDVENGVMAGLFVAKGFPAFGENDLFLSGAAYGGWAREHALLATLAQVEGRRGQGEKGWDSVIGSGRTALYLGGAGFVFLAEDRYSGGSASRLPLQLALGDRQGGILGYHNTALAGARRNVAHTEVRWSAASLVAGADVGIAPFAETGTVWAGDAPYGVDATRSTIGFSILAAYPTRSKRLYRADIGFPLSRGNGAGIEVRFSSEDRTAAFWHEPDDLSRSRTGPVPASLFAWQAR